MSKRDAILDATKTLLWEVGYESMSPRRVMDESGAGQGSLYHHFSGKLDLAATALGEIEAEMEDELDAAFDEALPPLDRVYRFLLKPRDALRGCRLGRLANESAIEAAPLREPIARYFGQLRTRLEAALGQAIAEGALPATLDPAQIAATMMTTIQGGYVLSRIQGDPSPLSDATAGVVAMVRTLSETAASPAR